MYSTTRLKIHSALFIQPPCQNQTFSHYSHYFRNTFGACVGRVACPRRFNNKIRDFSRIFTEIPHSSFIISHSFDIFIISLYNILPSYLRTNFMLHYFDYAATYQTNKNIIEKRAIATSISTRVIPL